MNTVKISLKHPVKVDGRETTELSMRRPKVRDMMLSDRPKVSDAEKELTLFASLLGISPDDLQELDMADYLTIQETYRGFLS
jgi:phage terminase small subunit